VKQRRDHALSPPHAAGSEGDNTGAAAGGAITEDEKGGVATPVDVAVLQAAWMHLPG
jgi:hypothetical protein